MSLADSPMKFFKVEQIEISWGSRTKALQLTCPRCEHESIVSLAWRNSSEYGTRPCTYCFRTFKIPRKRDWL